MVGLVARASRTGNLLARWMEIHCAHSFSRPAGHPLLPLPRLSGHRHRQAAHLTVVSLSPSSPAVSPSVSGDGAAPPGSLLAKLRVKKLKDLPSSPLKSKTPAVTSPKKKSTAPSSSSSSPGVDSVAESFEDLPLSDELMAAVNELGLTQPTEVQCRSIPAILDGQSVVIASHTGSGKTLAYMIPIVQCLKQDELQHDKAPRPRRPRAVVLCPTRELAEQVFRVAKSLCHHAKFRVTLIGGGVRMRPQEDALNAPLDMLVGTPGRLLKHVEDGNVAYGDIKYVVLDEADTMFDRGFGPDVKKFLDPLRSRSRKSESLGFQTVLVTATITQAVQKLLDDEFPGIKHIRTSTLHKKISTARHVFIKLASTENKLESLLQVLEPSRSKNERIMVFCNTLGSCRAVDHFLSENNIPTVNYHGAVPAEERVEGLDKFRSADQNCPALVCTDLAARGLDLVVDHVIMFDFPLNSIDYLHRTGRTARMGAKGKVTSLVSKRSLALAELIEEAIHKGETLECVSLVRKAAVEVKKQPAKAKVGEKRRETTQRSKGVRKSSAAKPTLQSARPSKRTTVVVSKSKKARIVQVARKGESSMKSGNQKISKRVGQRAIRASSKR